MITMKDKSAILTKMHKTLLLYLFFIIISLSVFIQITEHDFIDYDDHLYVTKNEHVKKGLSFENIYWSFKSSTAANWHPITMIFHMLDVQLFGMSAGGHHLTSLFLHIFNTFLVFHFFHKCTNCFWRSALVGALFCLHPLHVESVAQISQKKDLISTMLWFCALICYAQYVKEERIPYYMISLLFFVLGLMAKPMLVTMPFLLLLLDYWPFNRVCFNFSNTNSKDQKNTKYQKKPLYLIKEKLPFFFITIVFCVLTFLVQSNQGAVKSLNLYDTGIRFSNALVSYVNYISKTIWPTNLAFYYPYPETIALWQSLSALFLICAVTLIAIRLRQTAAFFLIGWLWFLGTFVPVIGLIQVGSQAMADRYTYVPIIGLFIIVSWGGSEITRNFSNNLKFGAIASFTALTVLTICAWRQTTNWKDSITLFQHAVNVTERNYVAHHNLGLALSERGKFVEAIDHSRKVIKANPSHKKAYNNLGLSLMELGNYEKAIEAFNAAIELDPGYTGAYNNMAVAYLKKGQIREAIQYYEQSLSKNSNQPDLYNNIGVILANMGQVLEGVKYLKKAAMSNKGSRESQNNLHQLLSPGGIVERKIEEIEKQLTGSDGDAELHFRLGNLHKVKGNLISAIENFKTAVILDPLCYKALDQLSLIYAMKGDYDTALSFLKDFIRKRPDYIESYYIAASIYARKSNVKLVIYWLNKAIEKGFSDWGRLETDPNFKCIKNKKSYKVFFDELKRNFTGP